MFEASNAYVAVRTQKASNDPGCGVVIDAKPRSLWLRNLSRKPAYFAASILLGKCFRVPSDRNAVDRPKFDVSNMVPVLEPPPHVAAAMSVGVLLVEQHRSPDGAGLLAFGAKPGDAARFSFGCREIFWRLLDKASSTLFHMNEHKGHSYLNQGVWIFSYAHS